MANETKRKEQQPRSPSTLVTYFANADDKVLTGKYKSEEAHLSCYKRSGRPILI